MSRGGIPIISNRLVEAREIRGMTSSELAIRIGKTRQLISAYENDTAYPTADTLSAISQVLNLPIKFFMEERDSKTNISDSTVFYRSMKGALAKQRLQTKWWLQWIIDRISYYQRHLDFPELRVPNFEFDYKNIDFDFIDDLAEKTRRFWGLQDGPIDNLTLLLENNGIIIAKDNLEIEELDACSVFAKGRPIIFVNTTKLTCSRYLMNLGHELGHIILHQGVSKSEIEDKMMLELIERQAWRFASAFLMPATTFGAEVYGTTLSSFTALKLRWRTAISAMIMRCYDLEIIDEYRKSYLFAEMARKRIRTKEPYDDVMQLEKPSLLLEADKMVSDKIAKEDMLESSKLTASDYCRLIGVEGEYFKAIKKKPILFAVK